MVTRIVQGWKEIRTTGTIEPVEVAGGSINVVGLGATTIKAAGTITALPAFTRGTILTAIADINFLNLSIVSVSGEDYAKFYLLINGVELDIRRTGPSRNLEFNYTGAPIELRYGDIVQVQVEHYNPSALPDFDCTLYGFGDVYAQLIEPITRTLSLTLHEPSFSVQQDLPVAFPLALTLLAQTLDISNTETPVLSQLTLTFYQPTLAIQSIASPNPQTSFVLLNQPWAAIHSFPATLPLQLIPLQPSLFTTNFVNTFAMTMDIHIDKTITPPDFLILMSDILQDRTFHAPFQHLVMSDIRIDRTITVGTLTISLGAIQLNRTLNPQTLGIISSVGGFPAISEISSMFPLAVSVVSPIPNVSLDAQILDLNIGEIQLNRTVNPQTLVINLSGLQLNRLLNPQTLTLNTTTSSVTVVII